jgi:hypothetical protein
MKKAIFAVIVAASSSAAFAGRPTWKGAGEASWDSRFDTRFDNASTTWKGSGEASWDNRFDERPENTSGKSFKGSRSETYDSRFGF